MLKQRVVELKVKLSYIPLPGDKPTEMLVLSALNGSTRVSPFSSVSVEKLKEVELPVFKVAYAPVNPYDIKVVRVLFKTKVSKDLVEKIVEYWSSIPYVGKYSHTDWQGNMAVIYVDVNQSKSSDVRRREILEQLGEWLIDGTPVRKGDGKRANEGLGDVVTSISGHRF